MRLGPAGRPESAISGCYRAASPFEGASRPPRSPFLSLTADRSVNAHRAVNRLGGFGRLAERAWLKPCVERSPLASAMGLSWVGEVAEDGLWWG